MALAHAQAAAASDGMNYKNWTLLGDVYRSMVSLGITDAYDRATSAYQEAQKRILNDSTMILYFQLALAKKDVDGALGFVKNSINAYPTADAYIVRAQIQIGQQKFDDAAVSLKAGLALDPYNMNLAYQYGLFLISQHHYSDAIPVLQRTILLNRNYAIAYVYLGYAYEKTGDLDNANRVYDYIKNQFPGGADAISAVKNSQIDQPAPQVPTPVITPVAPKKKK
jgi:predicted Zn-dependent protease